MDSEGFMAVIAHNVMKMVRRLGCQWISGLAKSLRTGRRGRSDEKRYILLHVEWPEHPADADANALSSLYARNNTPTDFFNSPCTASIEGT